MDTKNLTPQKGVGFFYERITMTTIKIDNKEYDVESLSEEAKAQLASIRFIDAEIERLKGHLAVMQTARI
jgi:hypothetical protein